MTARARSRTNAATTTNPVALALALALSLPALGPAYTQDAPFEGTSADAGPPLAGLRGPWLRNGELSENPVKKSQSMAREGRWVSSIMVEQVNSLAGRLETQQIRIMGESVVLLDGRGETLTLPLDGTWHALAPGRRGRVLVADGALTIETTARDWLRIETFRRNLDLLVRTTQLRSPRLASVRVGFHAVYERPRPGSTSRLPGADWMDALPQPVAIRIVPPERRHRELLSGRVEVRTLVIDSRVAAVEFLLDDRPTRRVRKPPYKTHIALADPPRQQTLEVRAYDTQGELAGSDRIVLNRIDGPFAVRIAKIRAEQTGGTAAVRVEAAVSVPRSALLERVDFYRSEDLVAVVNEFGAATNEGAARTIPVEAWIEDVRLDDFVRVSANLADGRELEDAELLQGADHQGEIDVQLVQLQVLVTDRDGNPASGLGTEDFEIRENGRSLAPEALHTAHDVPLVLGLAIDSSESMQPVWRRLRYVAGSFVATSLAPGDRAFLVDFDDTVRLLQPLTGNKALLSRRLDRLLPGGGTALHDGLLFSLLQYRSEPGRRALVVVTDGVDLDSRSRWEQAADFAEHLGLPIYFIELDQSVKAVIRNSSLVHRFSEETLQREKARRRLRRISRQTGGRLFHIEPLGDELPWAERIEQVFDQIEVDLRHQHVLTYYSDQPPGAPIEPAIRVTRRGLSLRSAVPLEAIE